MLMTMRLDHTKKLNFTLVPNLLVIFHFHENVVGLNYSCRTNSVQQSSVQMLIFHVVLLFSINKIAFNF